MEIATAFFAGALVGWLIKGNLESKKAPVPVRVREQPVLQYVELETAWHRVGELEAQLVEAQEALQRESSGQASI